MVYQETMPKNMFDNANTLNYYLHFLLYWLSVRNTGQLSKLKDLIIKYLMLIFFLFYL